MLTDASADDREQATPPFLLWALEFSCPLRGFQTGADPEKTERQLRAAIELSKARQAKREFQGYCLDPPLGFRTGEALAIYGGTEQVERTCLTCPANAQARSLTGALAGCGGILALPADSSAFCQSVDATIDQLGLASDYARQFHATRPNWFGLWMRSPLLADQCHLLAAVMETLKSEQSFDEPWGDILAGLTVAHQQQLALHARLYPRGVVRGNWWHLVLHCPNCQAEWSATGHGHCDICGFTGHPAPNKKRRARGRRPYLPLGRIMGDEAAAELLANFAAASSHRATNQN